MKGERMVTVIDFDTGLVTRVPASQAKQDGDELCRSQGHYFATAGAVPGPSARCICGDITFSEWYPASPSADAKGGEAE
jgi:hypothetical protein